MSIERSKSKDHSSLSPLSKAGGTVSNDLPPLRSFGEPDDMGPEPSGLRNLHRRNDADQATANEPTQTRSDANVVVNTTTIPAELSSNQGPNNKAERKAKQTKNDQALLTSDRWLARNGHTFTYVGLFLFSIMVLFRPYEIVPGLTFLASTAFYFALATLAIYFPSQIATEGTLTTMSTEVKALLALTALSLLTMPIARNPGMAWDTFNDSFSKSVIIFIVLVNVVRTRKRLMGMVWLSFGIGIYLSISALQLYMSGKFTVEEYRVGVEIGGMFGNPNEMAMHFVMMTPLAFAMGIAAKSKVMRLIYLSMGGLLIGANMVTFSRGGFLGLVACMVFFAFKIGRKYRLNVAIASIVITVIGMVAAPGNYGLRMLSIFIPGLDSVGSSNQRQELLWRSLLVSARNPWGIGIGNFPIVGIRDLQSHNAFTQVSAELGILGLVAYMIFMISPFRKLSAIERKHFDRDEFDWFYYVSIGLQASIVGYWVSSFFASVAYNWFIYYLIAYAVAFRRIYNIERPDEESETAPVTGQQPILAT